MADHRKDPVAKSLVLRPWDEFKRAMASFLKQFAPILREQIAIALYSRAEFRSWLEDLRFKESKRPSLLRQERNRGNRMRGHIQEAIDSLNKAKAAATQGSGETEYVRQAETLLKKAADDLVFLEELRIALVHPGRRNKTEKARKIMSATLEHWSLFPGFGTAKVDQMFVGWMESYLSVLVTTQGRLLSSPEINRIISVTLEAAFGEIYGTERARKARSRPEKKRISSGKK